MNIPLDSARIDSLSLAIPKEEITIIDQNICSRVMTYFVDTGELEKTLPQPPKPYILEYDDIRVRLKWMQRVHLNNKLKEYLVITVSSKLLRERYFQGITSWNIKYIYYELMSWKIFECSEESFLNGEASDVDICINYNISQEAFIRTNKKIISLAKPGFNRYFNWFCKKKTNSDIIINLGLDINSRSKAKPSTPYIKHYYKTVELLTKSFQFFNTFLAKQFQPNCQTLNNLARIEYTVKGYNHRRRLVNRGLLPDNLKTLNDWLEMDSKALNKVVYSGFEDYIYIPDRELKEIDVKDLSPTDIVILRLIEKVINFGGDEQDILEVIHDFQPKPKTRCKTKLKKLLKHLKTQNLSIENQIQKNEEINSFFDRLKR